MALPETGSDWIEWGGGECPVSPEAEVEGRLRGNDGGILQAKDWYWEHDGDLSDLVAYRILQPDAAPEPAANAEANILREAEDIIYGDREATYGHPAKNLESIARFWTGYLKQKYGLDAPLTPEDVCWMMALLKMSRQMNSHKRDNLVDAAGYLALIERVQGAVK